MSAEIATPQANYRPVKISAPRYRFRKIPLYNNGNNALVIQPGATIQSQFKIGADVYNLKRSFVSYSGTAPASGVGVYNWLVQDASEAYDLIQFTDQGSLPIANIQYAKKYARITRKLKTKFEKFMTMDPTCALNPSNGLITSVASILPAVDSRGGNGIGNLPASNYVECQYVQVGANNAPLTWTRQIPLEVYGDSIFETDRDQYFGRDMYLNGNMGNGAYIVHHQLIQLLAFNQQISLSNMYLYLAVEVNDEICMGLKQKYLSSGLTQMIQYPYSIRLPSSSTLGQTGVANLTYIIQPSNGLYLRKITFKRILL